MTEQQGVELLAAMAQLLSLTTQLVIAAKQIAFWSVMIAGQICAVSYFMCRRR